MNKSSLPILTWHGCYEKSWRGLITADSFTHPAKFAPGLIDAIYRHGFTAGWWKKGDTIGDPFGGIAGGGIFAGYHGLNWVGCELEEKFVGLGNANIALHAPKWLVMGETWQVKLLQGDSRHFAEIANGAVGIITSPPYAETLNHGGGPDTEKDLSKRSGGSLRAVKTGYGSTAGQIGDLPAGDLTAVVTSPPYVQVVGRWSGIDITKAAGNKTGHNSSAMAGAYGEGAGNIGNLPPGRIDAVVTSPPWEDQESAMNAGKFRDPEKFAAAMSRLDGVGKRNGTTAGSRLAQLQRQTESTYGESTGQIGNIVGETYWQAMHQVYSQCLLALKPGGVMCVVVKDYVKDKARVPLCDQTLQLLEHLGFIPVCRIHAMLAKERRHAQLFGADQIHRTERKSFFRRLAEKKGSPRIDWEEVIVVRKAAA